MNIYKLLLHFFIFSSLSTERIAECLVGGSAYPVLALGVDRPKTYRISGVGHVTLTDTSLLLVRNLVHVSLDGITI